MGDPDGPGVCGLDFAGIARLITQKGKSDDRKESWYLFSAWLIAAAFNATLTWWVFPLPSTIMR
jgi:hypothetical protein